MELFRKIIKKITLLYPKKVKINADHTKSKIFAWHINIWKRAYFSAIFPNKQLLFFPFKLTEDEFHKYWKQYILDGNKNSLLIWGMHCPDFLTDFILKYDINIEYVEDGFIRSIDLGSNHSLPLSLNFDTKTPYFNAQKESDLETLLQNYNFEDDNILIQRAINLRKNIINLGISKYNHAEKIDLTKLYGEKTKKRILVIGQVEDDASIQYGCKKPFTNNDLVHLAYEENPNAQIIYKPHPDVFFKKRKELSNPQNVKHLALIITESLPISQALETIDHVYTITSQVGFEALLRNIYVTVIGSPFYANWGVTDDRQNNPRRTRKLSVDEILAASYILYPKYFNSKTADKITPEEAITILIEERD